MSPAKLEAIAPVDANLTCAPHAFKNVHVLSREPLVVYIEGFLGPEETNEVVALR
jgi:prolyl 4-hydroxylase